MDLRQQRGKIISDTCHMERRGEMWLVPSQSTGGRYAVHTDGHLPSCSCPDYELRGMKCKHIFAVAFTKQKWKNVDGTTTVASTVTVVETIKAKFGDAVRSKTDTAMRNEVLAKIVCHNIVVLIHEMYELGIEPSFWSNTPCLKANPVA